MILNLPLLYESLPALFRGAVVTLQISLTGCLLGIVFGTLFGIALTRYRTPLYWVVLFYGTLVRGTPMLIQILIVRYVFPQFGLDFSLIWSAIIAIAINSTAYISYIVRAGINSVRIGQIEAAQTLGFSRLQIARYIIFPQACTTVLPILGNELITLIKDSSLASTIGVVELTKVANQIRSSTFDALTPFFAVALIYLLITATLSFLFSKLERKMDPHVTY